MSDLKKLRNLIILALSLVFVLSLNACVTIVPELIPRDVLLEIKSPAIKTIPKISPDGKKISYLASSDKGLGLWIKTIGLEDDRIVMNDIMPFNYFWTHDNEHIIYHHLGRRDSCIFSIVELETGDFEDLVVIENMRVFVTRHYNYKENPNDLILLKHREENTQIFDVYYLNLNSGKLEQVMKNPGNVVVWRCDLTCKIHGVEIATVDGLKELKIRQDGEWEKIISWDQDNRLPSWFVGFSAKGKYLYLVDSREVNTSRLIKLDIRSGNSEVIAEDSQYDVAEVILHPYNNKIQAVAFSKPRIEWVVLDESVEEDFLGINKLDKGDFFIVDRDLADNVWIIEFKKDTGSGSFWAYNRKLKKGYFLYDKDPILNSYTLASMEPISFKARDGLTIHGYITYPPGKGRSNLPLILKVHGGPWIRDTWVYDPETQLFVDRGYACLQINFRGSLGFGKDFLNAGNKEWGGKMHDDLVDAANWAIERGIADPEKIAIFGWSYGGYAALVGATFTPDIFCCAVSINGPSNLVNHLKNYRSELGFQANMYKRVGNPDTEENFLKSRSPLFKVNQINIPVFIAQGSEDELIKRENTDEFVEAMKKQGIEYDYMLFPGEGHNIRWEENRRQLYGSIEKFLSKHLGGRYEEYHPDSGLIKVYQNLLKIKKRSKEGRNTGNRSEKRGGERGGEKIKAVLKILFRSQVYLCSSVLVGFSA
jgi:dipeptidyl aminopeptidase/acylaminoacyl peptidase